MLRILFSIISILAAIGFVLFLIFGGFIAAMVCVAIFDIFAGVLFFFIL